MRTSALLAIVLATAFGIKVPPHRYGRVVLQNGTARAGVPAVTFDHWRHRARYTCRLCHVDVGFAMESGATGISAATNRKGFHCGACHDGKTGYQGKPIFAACSASQNTDRPRCRVCHGVDDARAARDYAALSFARGSFGEVEWGKAEEEGKIRLVDALEGFSIPRPALKMDRDIIIESIGSWMTNVRFSHRKHAVWNGCEVCHPEIYPSTKAGTVKFTMFDIADGKSCGACHGLVAFPLAYCERCHFKPVQFP